MKIKNMLSGDGSYKESIKEYDKIDGIIAIAYYFFLILIYYYGGKINYNKQIYLGVLCNVIVMISCIFIIKFRKQSLKSVGITLKNINKSIILGVCTGLAVIICKDIIPGMFLGKTLDSAKNISINIVYYFIAIAFVEEVIFRGFIQTRIYGLIKSDVLAVIVGSIMFSSMHIPFQMAAVNMSLTNFLLINRFNLVFLCFMHIVFNFLYRKYNNVFTSTIFHGFVDLGDRLFF